MASSHRLHSSNSAAPAARRGKHWSSGWYALAVALLLVATGTVAPHAQGRGQGRGPQRRADRADLQLAERLNQGDGTDRERVIITLKPGAKRRLLQELQAYGERADQDFGVIDAFAGRLPRRMLRQLRQHPDVVSMSVDADVSPMSVAGVTGTAQGSAYSLRSTLGLTSPSATATTKTFQQGANSYTATVDGGIEKSVPTTSYASVTTMEIEQTATDESGLLIRFDQLVGTGTGQIPPGATITSATLRVAQLADGSSSATASLYRMLATWNASATWNGMATSGAGVQLDNVEALASADATISGLTTTGYRTFSGTGLTAALQYWVNGGANNGWLLWQNNSNDWTVRTSETSTLANRPLLTVTYKAPVETTTRTGAGVTVAVIDSGLLQDGGGTTRIKTTRDFTTGSANPPAVSASDGYGHGTHVAGLIGGDKVEVKGVAPGVSYVSLKVLNSLGVGATSHVINAIQWAVANKTAYGIDIINLSLGHPIFEPAATDPLVQAVEAAVRAGIVVVASAGNMGVNPLTGQVGYAGISSPGNAPSAITVGAAKTFDTTTRTDDLVADYSSRGPTWYDGYAKPDVVAPGHRLLGPAATTQTLYTLLRAIG